MTQAISVLELHVDRLLRRPAAVTETAGLTRTSGIVGDNQAFCSIPADLVVRQATPVFKL